jgi:hypothetical protein
MQKIKATKSEKGFRKYNQFRVTATYTDNEISGRVYNNHEKTEKFAGRQKQSPTTTPLPPCATDGGSYENGFLHRSGS